MTFTAGRNKWLLMWHIITTVKDTHGYSPLTYEIVRFTSSGFTLTLTSTMFLVILGGAKSVCTCRTWTVSFLRRLVLLPFQGPS